MAAMRRHGGAQVIESAITIGLFAFVFVSACFIARWRRKPVKPTAIQRAFCASSPSARTLNAHSFLVGLSAFERQSLRQGKN